jgi:hypothetical protein
MPAMAATAVNELWTVGMSPADSPRKAVQVSIVPELKER